MIHHAKNFYPRSPCGERPQRTYQQGEKQAFLSTLSLRRATTWARGSRVTYVISIHALLAESDWLRCWQLAARDISIHALLAESDEYTNNGRNANLRRFLSTLSLRRATVTVLGIQHKVGISIHALLAESDTKRFSNTLEHLHFYPRSPCGERRISTPFCWATNIFLSTLSLRRATQYLLCPWLYNCHFYPRSPCGERRGLTTRGLLSINISIHALLAESDSTNCPQNQQFAKFLSTLSLRRATATTILRHCTMWTFLSTLSLRRATST